MTWRRVPLVFVAVLIVLGMGFSVGWVMGTRAGAVPAPAEHAAGALHGLRDEYLAVPASAEELFPEFLCPCCGEPIGECTCGMAAERRAFLKGQTAASQNRLDILVAYAGEYGLDMFASGEVRADVRAYQLASAPEDRPQIEVDRDRLALGDVSVAAGRVQTSVTLRNTGAQALIVDGLSTSCGCTTAFIVNEGQQGPEFGAGAAVEGWSTTIQPGESAELRITYDPAVHADARGLMVREVHVSSNDPVDPVINVTIELNQVD